jgi:preprotein translocase subunit SecB
MRRAQISLTNYFVSELTYTANREFDVTKPSIIAIADYEVTPRAEAQTENRRKWEVGLRVALTATPEKNFPCSFMLDLVGSIEIDDTLREEYIDRFVNINGVALVFGAAREIVRALTSAGPSKPVLLPSVTFWEPKEPPVSTGVSTLTPTAGGPTLSNP